MRKLRFFRVATIPSLVAFIVHHGFLISPAHAEDSEDRLSSEPVFYDPEPKLIMEPYIKSVSGKQKNPDSVPFSPNEITLTGPVLLFENEFKSLNSNNTPFDRTTLPAGGMVIEGDKMHIYMDRHMRSIGHAAIHEEKRDIYGDRIEYDTIDGQIHVMGNAQMESEDISIKGPEMHLVLNENTGEILEPDFKLTVPVRTRREPSESSYENNLKTQLLEESPFNIKTPSIKRISSRATADVLKFQSENIKNMTNVSYTSCDAGSNDWYIKASELEINTQSKSATAHNANIEFKGVPILYSPWMDFSYSSDRKSGFLSPIFGTTSRSGFEFLSPYYWNISPNLDATFGIRALSQRGLQLQGELRYLEPAFYGTNNIEYLPSDQNTGEDRFYTRLIHSHNLGNGWIAGYNFEKVSDDQYFSELSTRITSTSRVILPQRAYVIHADENWSFTGALQKYQTLNGVSYPYEMLPQLTFQGFKDWDFLSGKLDTELVSFEKASDAPKDVTGSRFTMYPNLSYSFSKPFGYITPKLGIHHTSYSLNNINNNLPDTPSRTIPTFTLDSGVFFDRDMSVIKNQYTQTLEPRLLYVYIPYRDQDKLPIFDTGQSDLNLATLFQENQFTGYDRINDANQLSLAVTSRIIDNKTGMQKLSATIGQRYYFSDQKVALPSTNLRTKNSSDLIAGVSANISSKLSFDYFWQYDTDSNTLIRSNIGAKLTPEPGKVLNFAYRYTQDKIEQINTSAQWPLGNGLYALGRINYSIKDNQPIESIAGLEYDAGCWQARTVMQRVTTATAQANYALFFQIELGGLASIGANPLLLLKRSIPGYVSTGDIPDEYKQSLYE